MTAHVDDDFMDSFFWSPEAMDEALGVANNSLAPLRVAIAEIVTRMVNERFQWPPVTASAPEFGVDDCVQVVGLCQQTHFNGREGRVLSLPEQPHGRYEVRLQPTGPTLAVKPRHITRVVQPATTGHVLLHGLTSRSHQYLNGQSATVVPLTVSTEGRVTVTTGDGPNISVPARCTLPLMHSEFVPQRASATLQCCVCLASGMQMTVADPCGHVCVCCTCAQSFARCSPCPLCRGAVIKFFNIYM